MGFAHDEGSNYKDLKSSMQRRRLGKQSNSNHKRSASNNSFDSNNKYSGIFYNRKILLNQQEKFESIQNIKKDENMWNYNVRNMYDYAVLKI